ncbi:MAG: efflux RND transporter periplasmic adaptor subunit [Thermodesulfobacteriota bacterium]
MDSAGRTRTVFLLLACAGFLLASAPAPAAEETAAVTVVRPQTRTVEQSADIFGTFQAPDRSLVGSLVAGALKSLDADEGDAVKAGQVLAALDSADYQLALDLARQQQATARAQVDQAKAGLALCETNLATARADLDRIKPVVESGSFPKQKLDHAQNGFDAATAARSQAAAALSLAASQAALAETQVAIAKKRLADCRILAPYDGVVSQRLANLGEWIMPGKPVFAVEKVNPIEVKGDLSEVYLARTGISAPVEVSVDGAAGGPWKTELSEIAPTADPRTRTVTVTARLKNPDRVFRPGMSARLKIILSRQKGALVIPSRCLLAADGGKQGDGKVFVVENGVARMRALTLGEPFREWITVVSGLSPEDRVVSWGQSKLKDGDRVIVKETKSGGEK